MNQWTYLVAILARGATRAWQEYQRSRSAPPAPPRCESWPHPSVTVPTPHPVPASSPEVQARIDELVQEANTAYDRVAGRRDGVQMRVDEMQATAEGICPVCGDVFTTGERRCPACATPHHGDCWSWAGGCAMYGCRYRRG